MAVIDQHLTDRFGIYNGDCLEVIPTLPNESIDHVLYSPPFAGLFHYSSSEHDLSNCQTYEQFFEHYEYVVAETARVLKPGRIAAVHCMDVPKDGANIAGYRDFPGDVIRLHEKCGFEYTPRICIWKDPWKVRLRTMLKALRHWQIVDDATKANVAAADYLIPFRKRGVNPVPVAHPQGIYRYAGEREIPKELRRYCGWQGDQKLNRYSHWIWRNYASCFWDDIRLDRVLPYRDAKEMDDERHIHPLQLDVIERCCTLWTNPGETVLTPFMGIGSEVYGALINDRRGIGIELKPAYYKQAVKNLTSAVEVGEQASLEFVNEGNEAETGDMD